MEASTSTKTEIAPPYVPYKTLMGVIERMENEGAIPSQIDKSYLTNVPWSVQGQLLTAFRSLALTDENGQPTEILNRLVHEPDSRKALWQHVLRQRYPGPLGLSKNATQQQLEDQFKNYGLSIDTQRKAVSFFLTAAKEAGFELSPLFKAQRAPSGTRRPRTRKKQEPENGDKTIENNPPSPPAPELHPFLVGLLQELPPAGGSWSAAKRQAWLEIAERTVDMLYTVDNAPATRRPSPNGQEGGESSR